MVIIVINAGKVIVIKNEIKHFGLKSKNGFTLVELSLSMVFIAVLSVIIVLVINGTVSSYRRGITLNLLNTVGSELVSDITTAVQESPIDGELCHNNNDDDGSCRYASRTNYAKVEGKRIPVSGAFCTGKYSYVWNSGYYFDDNYQIEGEKMRVVDKDGREVLSEFKLAKILDTERNACLPNTDDTNEIKISGEEADAEDVLDENNSGVAVYNFEVNPPVDGGGGGQLYLISLTLGTAQSGMNINVTGGECAAPAESNSNPDYCAINTFRFAALANGGKSNEGE